MSDTSKAVAVSGPLTPEIWTMLERIGTAAHLARTFGVSSPQEAQIKLLFCLENGLPLSAANNGLYLIKGRMAVQSNLIAAQLRRHPGYDYKVTRLDDTGCTVAILRKQGNEWEAAGEASFTQSDAQRADLGGKETYQAYPSDMYFARAISRAQRRYAPDIFSGPVYAPEDLADGNVIDGHWEVQPQEPAKPTMTLEQLLEQYGPEAIMDAAGGVIPGTDEEVAAAAVKLAAEAVRGG